MAEAFLKQDFLECIWRYNNHDGGGGAGSVQITSSCWSRVTTHALGCLDVFLIPFLVLFKSGQGRQ
jgi:hypothetical protein